MLVPSVMALGVGLWEVIKFGGHVIHHPGWDRCQGMRKPVLILSAGGRNPDEDLPKEPHHAGTLILDFEASRTVRNTFDDSSLS